MIVISTEKNDLENYLLRCCSCNNLLLAHRTDIRWNVVQNVWGHNSHRYRCPVCERDITHPITHPIYPIPKDVANLLNA
jgi:uncharacterized protein with PIN domain